MQRKLAKMQNKLEQKTSSASSAASASSRPSKSGSTASSRPSKSGGGGTASASSRPSKSGGGGTASSRLSASEAAGNAAIARVASSVSKRPPSVSPSSPPEITRPRTVDSDVEFLNMVEEMSFDTKFSLLTEFLKRVENKEELSDDEQFFMALLEEQIFLQTRGHMSRCVV